MYVIDCNAEISETVPANSSDSFIKRGSSVSASLITGAVLSMRILIPEDVKVRPSVSVTVIRTFLYKPSSVIARAMM